MNPQASAPLPCPVCGTAVNSHSPAPCPVCGLPAAGRAALVVARIGATLTELTRDRDGLLATLHAAAPGRPAAPSRPAAPGRPAPAPTPMPPPPAPPMPPRPVPLPSAIPPARRLSPQQVLLGLGALLLVAGALAFVALAWTRLGLAFQATVMLVVTATACGTSAWAARRGLRATEEALAAAGAALLAVDLGAAWGKGLLGLDSVPLHLWAGLSCVAVVSVGLALGRLTRTTATWPLVALLAAHPAPFLLLGSSLAGGPAGVAAALALGAVDVGAAHRLRPGLRAVSWVLACVFVAVGTAEGLTVAGSSEPVRSWGATAVLAGAAAASPLLGRVPRIRTSQLWPQAVGGPAAVTGAALALSLRTLDQAGMVAASYAALVLLTAAAALVRAPVAATALAAGGAGLGAVAAAELRAEGRTALLAVLVLGLIVPALVTWVLRPPLRRPAAAVAVLAPAGAVLLGLDAGRLSPAVAGLLLAVVAAGGFAAAALRAGAGEEWVAAVAASAAGMAAASVGGSAAAWGQVGLQLAISGSAALAYALVAGRRWVRAIAIGDLVVAAWIAIAGARVETPEAYTLPAALGLLLVLLPRLRSAAPSWSAEGPAIAVAVLPSAFVVVAEPTALRLALVVAGSLALTVAGTLTHRQAPFVLGGASLAFVAVGRIAPYAPLLPRWLALALGGLVLLALGATYERRRQQTREAVAWVAHMR